MGESFNHKECQPVPVEVKEVLEKGIFRIISYMEELNYLLSRSEGSGREGIAEADWVLLQ